MMVTTNDDDKNLTTAFLPQDVENDTLQPQPRRSKLSLLTLAIGTLGCCTALTALAYTRHNNSEVSQTVTESSWIPIADQLSPNKEFGNFGYDVALSDKAAVLVVGQPFAKTVADKGQLLFYRLDADNGAYNQIGEPVLGKEENDNFGWSVAVTADGEWAVASAPNQNNMTGAVHMFAVGKEGDNEVHHKGEASGKEANDYFGWSVAISDTALSEDLHQIRTARVCVGAPAIDNHGMGKKGYVRVLEVDMAAKTWKQVGGDIEGDDEKEFGTSVGISSGGDVVVVGTPLQNKVGVFMFLVGQWVQKGPDISIEVDIPDANCGSSVDVSADGNKVVIGCKNFDMVHTYYWKDNNWKLAGNGIHGNFGMGQSVSMSAKGSHLAFGNPDYGDDANGEVLVYEWNSNYVDWVPTFSVLGNPGERAGSSVCISPDGEYFAMGAPHVIGNDVSTQDDTPLIESGNVQVFGSTK